MSNVIYMDEARKRLIEKKKLQGKFKMNGDAAKEKSAEEINKSAMQDKRHYPDNWR